jgi:hypothetical protein
LNNIGRDIRKRYPLGESQQQDLAVPPQELLELYTRPDLASINLDSCCVLFDLISYIRGNGRPCDYTNPIRFAGWSL